jgi:hypothetical protein
LYNSSKMHGQEPLIDSLDKQKHVFFSTSTSIAISRNSRSTIREVFKPNLQRSGSTSRVHIPSARRTYHFNFDLPRGSRPGEELPPTFSPSTLDDGVVPTRSTPSTEVLYTVSASWEPTSGSRDGAVYVISYPPRLHIPTNYHYPQTRSTYFLLSRFRFPIVRRPIG